MPDKVLIDAVTYQISKTDEVIIVNCRECNADVDYNAAEIKISNRYDKVGDGAITKVLMHEVVHAMLHERGLDEDAENETLVEELAKGFVNLIRQNPKLVDFVNDILVETEGAK